MKRARVVALSANLLTAAVTGFIVTQDKPPAPRPVCSQGRGRT
ncbi:MAG TPA: hypothetical protein VGF55_27075 [Gemmataceae bacterium]|jgi:hypothetical protein